MAHGVPTRTRLSEEKFAHLAGSVTLRGQAQAGKKMGHIDLANWHGVLLEMWPDHGPEAI
jgi:hypothetical protein